MKRIACLAFLLSCVAAGQAAAQERSLPPPQPGPAALWRVTLVVPDIAPVLRVWRDVLGFRLAYEGGSLLRDPRMVRLFGLAEGEGARLYVLVSGNTALGNIGFLVPERPVAAHASGRVAAGAPALFVKTTQLDAVVPRLVEAGCTLLAAPDPAATPGRNRMAWLVDPNGVRFVLTERERIDLSYAEPR